MDSSVGRGAALLLAACAIAPAPAAALDPGRLTWRELHYHARKLIFSADMHVRVEVLPTSAAARDLVSLSSHEAVTPCGDRLVRLELDTSGLGRHTRNTVWLEPATGAALQAISQEFGRRARFKTQRFTGQGVATTRHSPASGEGDHSASRWSERRDSFVPFPEGNRSGIVVSDSLALFWVLATAELVRPGDAVTLAVLARSQLLLVEVSVRATRRVTLDLDERSPRGERHVRASIEALELGVDARPLAGGAPADDLEFLGMKGSIRIVLDPVRRVPLEISGRVPVAGTVTVRLRDLVLSD